MGSPSAELHTRWLQAAALTPYFRTHSNDVSAARALGPRRRTRRHQPPAAIRIDGKPVEDAQFDSAARRLRIPLPDENVRWIEIEH